MMLVCYQHVRLNRSSINVLFPPCSTLDNNYRHNNLMTHHTDTRHYNAKLNRPASLSC